MLALALSPLAVVAAYPYPFLDPTLSDDARIADLLPRVPLQTKIDTLQTSHQAGIPGSGVPASPGYIVLPEYTIETYSTSECLHGYCSASNMTVFAQSITLAASFNAPLLRQVGAKIGEEARAVRNAFEATEQFPNKTATPNGLACFSPQINIVRVRSCPTPSQPGPHPASLWPAWLPQDCRWGRAQETYGEDPHLTSRLAYEYVRGMQGDDPKYIQTISSPKHFDACERTTPGLGCDAAATLTVDRCCVQTAARPPAGTARRRRSRCPGATGRRHSCHSSTPLSPRLAPSPRERPSHDLIPC